MKKLLLIGFTLFTVGFGIAQTTATNFTVTDCAGTSRDLFTELNSGKVVVISWVMPCGACIGPTMSAYTEVQNYLSSNPGKILFYISDDVGNTSCSTLTSWANTNSMAHGSIIVSDAAVNMADYGGAGMPKVVVIGGSSHTVFYNQGGALDVSAFDNAIQQALATGISENAKADFNMSLFPNPATSNKITLSYDLSLNSDISVDIYNTLGTKMKNIVIEKQISGKHETQIDLESLSNGVYFIRLNVGKLSQTVKFTVSH